MTVHAALLRGINVGGNKLVNMAELRALVTGLGFTGTQSLLQSGNLVFAGISRRASDLERVLETELKQQLNVQSDFFVRTAAELQTVIAHNHFPKDAERDPGHLLVMFLKSKPTEASVKALQAAIVGPELVHADGKHLYITYPAGIGRSRLTNSLIDSKLGTRGTGRNWNTVLKLAAMAESLGG